MMITLLRSHVPAKGDGPSDVREGIEDVIILTLDCPRNSLLKIKKYCVLGFFTRFNRFSA